MALRWRRGREILLCAARSEPQEGDTYIDDRLHQKLAVDLRVVWPDVTETESGLWWWTSAAEEANRVAEADHVDH